MIDSLRARLILSHTVLILLTLCIVGAGVLFVLRDFQDAVLTLRLNDAIRPSATVAQDLLKRGSTPPEIVDAVQARVQSVWYVLLVNEQNDVIADSKNQFVGRRFPANVIPVRRIGPGPILVGGRTMYIAAAAVSPVNTPRQVLVLAAVDRPLLGGIEELALPLATAGIIALFVSLLVAVVLARSIAEPLHALTRASAEMTRGNYVQEIPVRGQDEVSRLAASFNRMARAVHDSQQIQKDFVANVSHELKTPLTTIQGFSQAIAEGATRDLESTRRAGQLIYEESQRMAHLVGDLLTLARLEGGALAMHPEPIDLAQLVPHWVERFRPRAQEAEVGLTIAVEPMPRLEGDPARLEEVVANLVDNAIKYNRRGGTVTVSAECLDAISPLPPSESAPRLGVHRSREPQKDGLGRWAVIRVSDTGPGIPAEHLPRLFERFYRADKARAAGGTGLGLSIAQQIVQAHHGALQVSSRPGQGSTFSVWLPAGPGPVAQVGG